MASNTSTNSGKHPYLRPELWINGTLQFWRTALHNQAAYEPFLENRRKEMRMVGEKK